MFAPARWLLATLMAFAAFSGCSLGAMAQEAHSPQERVFVDVRRPSGGFRLYAFKESGEAMVTLNRLLPFGLDPQFDPATGSIRIIGADWDFRCRLGTRKATVNGKSTELPVKPHLKDVRRSYEVPPDTLPVVPMLTIARLRGYRIEHVPESDGREAGYVLTAPGYTPLEDYKRQELANDAVRSGRISAKAELFISEWQPGAIPASYTLRVRVEIVNNSKETYLASDEFAYLELQGGTVLRGENAAKSATARDLSVVIRPGERKTLLAGPWIVEPGRATPVKRFVYMDGRNRFVWGARPGE